MGEREKGGEAWPKPVAKRAGPELRGLWGWSRGWLEAGPGRSGRLGKVRGQGWRAETLNEVARESAMSEVGGEARWAVKRPGPAEQGAETCRGQEEAGKGWPPVRPRPEAAPPRVPLAAAAAAEAVAAVAAGRA